MANKIDGLDVRPVRVSAGNAVRKVEDVLAGKAGGSTAEPSPNEVEITSTARTLGSLEQSVQDMPAIDQKRVEEIQRKLEQGQYKVDPQRIADGLLRLESELKGPARK
ncbi:MAG: flagellar biosynthesis anti-sigma factor FlgM [Steroidobacteraceae bacterium]